MKWTQVDLMTSDSVAPQFATLYLSYFSPADLSLLHYTWMEGKMIHQYFHTCDRNKLRNHYDLSNSPYH